jgi:hypothetical protein
VHNGKHTIPPAAVRNDVLGVAGSSIGVMLDSSMDALMLRAYIAARAHGYEFRTVSIPGDVDIGKNSLAFDPEQMRTTFEAGYQLGSESNPWSNVPPFVEDLPVWVPELIDFPH